MSRKVNPTYQDNLILNAGLTIPQPFDSTIIGILSSGYYWLLLPRIFNPQNYNIFVIIPVFITLILILRSFVAEFVLAIRRIRRSKKEKTK